MTCYVDELRTWRSGDWCHLMADTDAELHRMAYACGIHYASFQGDHYDLRPSKRRIAMAYGAVEVSSRFLVRLRRQRRSQSDNGRAG